jgi:hypothetical protein
MSDREAAVKFLNSMRGQYILSQALCLAIKEINSREPHRREPSNVADMEFLLENLFPIYRAVEQAEAAYHTADPETKKALAKQHDEILGGLIDKARQVSD